MYVSIMKHKEGATLKNTLNLVGYMILLPVMARNHSWVHILAYDNSFRKSVPAEENWKVIHNIIWLATSASQPPPSTPSSLSLDLSSLSVASKLAKLQKSAAAKEKERQAPARQPSFFPCFLYNLSRCTDATWHKHHACVICEEDGHSKHSCPLKRHAKKRVPVGGYCNDSRGEDFTDPQKSLMTI